MVIYRISLLLEILTTIIFLYGVYGEKLQIGYKEIILVAVDLIILEGIDSGYLPYWINIVIYFLIAVFCVWRFGWNGKKLLVNSVLHIIFLGSIQMVCFSSVCYLTGSRLTEDFRILLTNLLMLLLCTVALQTKRLEKISYYFRRNDFIVHIILGSGAFIVLMNFYWKKADRGLYLGDYLFTILAVLVISLLTVSWQFYKLKAKERERELEAYKVYEESYKNLIDDIRLKQHEFDNHISAIFSQHATCKTYEELVEQQRGYCESILDDNKYEKLLKAENSVLIGFLYGKFLEAEKQNIRVEYDIRCGELHTRLPMHKIVEITGDLLNNAMDALKDAEDKRMYISIMEKLGVICMEVRNVHEELSEEQIHKMFQKGYSGKGENRGLGLYNIKKLGQDYDFTVICRNEEHEHVNWISFRIFF